MFHPVIMMSTYTPDKTKQLFQLLSVDVYTPHLPLSPPLSSLLVGGQVRRRRLRSRLYIP